MGGSKFRSAIGLFVPSLKRDIVPLLQAHSLGLEGSHGNADRRRCDEGDKRLVLIVYNSGLDLAELRLKNALNGLCVDTVPAHFELRVEAAEEVHALCLNVDFAFIAGAVEAAELRMRDELFGRELKRRCRRP